MPNIGVSTSTPPVSGAVAGIAGAAAEKPPTSARAQGDAPEGADAVAAMARQDHRPWVICKVTKGIVIRDRKVDAREATQPEGRDAQPKRCSIQLEPARLPELELRTADTSRAKEPLGDLATQALRKKKMRGQGGRARQDTQAAKAESARSGRA